MGLLDILRGQRTPKRANLDRLFAISTSELTLVTALGLAPSGRAGLCFKAIDAGAFDALVADIDGILEIAGAENGTTVSRHTDEYGYSWVVLSDPDLSDLVTATHMVSQTMQESRLSEQLLCAVFGFTHQGRPLDIIYNYKRATFYPFAPTGTARSGTRDNTLELRVRATVEREMPIEPELERWYAVWDAPVHDAG